MPSLTGSDGTQVLVRRTMPTDGSEPYVVLIVGSSAAALTPAEAYEAARNLTSVASIIEEGAYRRRGEAR